MVYFGDSVKMIKSGKVDTSNTCNGFKDFSFLINKTSSDETFYVFFYIFLAIEEKNKLMENIKGYKGRERVKKQEIDKEKIRRERKNKITF